jgi:hypothetical protein
MSDAPSPKCECEIMRREFEAEKRHRRELRRADLKAIKEKFKAEEKARKLALRATNTIWAVVFAIGSMLVLIATAIAAFMAIYKAHQ